MKLPRWRNPTPRLPCPICGSTRPCGGHGWVERPCTIPQDTTHRHMWTTCGRCGSFNLACAFREVFFPCGRCGSPIVKGSARWHAWQERQEAFLPPLDVPRWHNTDRRRRSLKEMLNTTNN